MFHILLNFSYAEQLMLRSLNDAVTPGVWCMSWLTLHNNTLIRTRSISIYSPHPSIHSSIYPFIDTNNAYLPTFFFFFSREPSVQIRSSEYNKHATFRWAVMWWWFAYTLWYTVVLSRSMSRLTYLTTFISIYLPTYRSTFLSTYLPTLPLAN